MLEEQNRLPFSSAGYAHIIFEDPESLTQAIRSNLIELDDCEAGAELKGVEKWLADKIEEINIDKEKLQQEVNDFMVEYDKRKLEFKNRLETLSSHPDDDGWVTVTKGKKSGQHGAAKFDQESLTKLIQREKKKQKTDFYRFQRTDQTNSHIQELRKRFEEDKKRVEKLRQGRKFRPF